MNPFFSTRSVLRSRGRATRVVVTSATNDQPGPGARVKANANVPSPSSPRTGTTASSSAPNSNKSTRPSSAPSSPQSKHSKKSPSPDNHRANGSSPSTSSSSADPPQFPAPFYINKEIIQCQTVEELFTLVQRRSSEFNQVNAATAYHRLGRLWTGPTSRLARHPGFLQLTSLLASKVPDMNMVSLTGILNAHQSLKITPSAVLSRIPRAVVNQQDKIAWGDLGLFLLLFCRVYGTASEGLRAAEEVSDLLLSKSTKSATAAAEDSSPIDTATDGPIASEADIAQCFAALCKQSALRIKHQHPRGFVAALIVAEGVADKVPEARQLLDKCMQVLSAPGDNPLLTNSRWDARSTCVLLYAVSNTRTTDRLVLGRIVEATYLHMEGKVEKPAEVEVEGVRGGGGASTSAESPRARKPRPTPRQVWVPWDGLYEYEVSRTAYALAKILELLVTGNADAAGWTDGSPFEASSRRSDTGAFEATHPASSDLTREEEATDAALQVAFEQSAAQVAGAESVLQGGMSARPGPPGPEADRSDLVSSVEFHMRQREFRKGQTESLILKSLSRFAELFPADTRQFSFRSLAAVLYAYALTQEHRPALLTNCEERIRLLVDSLDSAAPPSSFPCDLVDGLRPASFNPQTYGSVVWSFAKLDWSSDLFPTLAEIALQARDIYYKSKGPDAVPFFHSEAQVATMIIVAYAQIASGPHDPAICEELMVTIAEDAAKLADKLASRTIANILWSLSVAQLYPRDVWTALKHSLDRFSGTDLGTRELWQLHLANTAFRLECSWKDTAAPPSMQDQEATADSVFASLYNRGQLARSAQQEWEQGQAFSRKIVSLLHLDVAKVLQDICHEMDLEYSFEYYDMMIYSVDLALPKYRIAIEVDGPIHFSANTQELMGSTRLKRRILKASGWHVISVSIFEWNALKYTDDKTRWLRERLVEAIEAEEGIKGKHKRSEEVKVEASVSVATAADSAPPAPTATEPQKVNKEAARALLVKKALGGKKGAASAASILSVISRNKAKKSPGSESDSSNGSGLDLP